ncbi:uncharacterized protein LOC142774959 [Rhipicephalus microplus]|uniref:uncharacterized protein LOC142774959 n=1 Tax=Rhipicephalus microplus TaxID=6941 RepID=UPI003F6CC6AE
MSLSSALNAQYAKLDNDALIYNVEARPALWQSRHKDHKNRFKKRILWAEVAAAVLPGVSDAESMVQKRWKSLRDKFRRLATAQVAQKNGTKTEDQAADGNVDDVTWPHYDQLLFLKTSMEGIWPVSNENVPGGPSEETLLAIAPYGDVDCVSLLSVESNHGALPAASPSTDSQAMVSDLSDQETAAAEMVHEVPSPPPQRRQRKRKKDEDLQQQLEEVSSLLEKPPDEDEYFAMSLVSHMRAVKPEYKLQMRMKVLQVVQMFKDQ